MPDYRETTEAGTSHRRSFAVHFRNPYAHLEESGVTFEEEDVLVLADRVINIVSGSITAGFTPTETFHLMDPATGQPTGVVASHMDVYVMLNSLYIDLALKRDAAAAAAPPPEPQPQP